MRTAIVTVSFPENKTSYLRTVNISNDDIRDCFIDEDEALDSMIKREVESILFERGRLCAS